MGFDGIFSQLVNRLGKIFFWKMLEHLILLGKMKKKYFHRLKDSKEIVYLNMSRIETRRIQLNRCVFV